MHQKCGRAIKSPHFRRFKGTTPAAIPRCGHTHRASVVSGRHPARAGFQEAGTASTRAYPPAPSTGTRRASHGHAVVQGSVLVGHYLSAAWKTGWIATVDPSGHIGRSGCGSSAARMSRLALAQHFAATPADLQEKTIESDVEYLPRPRQRGSAWHQWSCLIVPILVPFLAADNTERGVPLSRLSRRL